MEMKYTSSIGIEALQRSMYRRQIYQQATINALQSVLQRHITSDDKLLTRVTLPYLVAQKDPIIWQEAEGKSDQLLRDYEGRPEELLKKLVENLLGRKI